jgi:murein DD-endopeptidase MepM/ murein hydrolase activator NlpD
MLNMMVNNSFIPCIIFKNARFSGVLGSLAAAMLISVVAISDASASQLVDENAPNSTQATSPLKLNGKFTQGALLRGEVPEGSTVLLNEQPVAVNKDGKFVVGFARDAKLNHVLTVKAAKGSVITREITLEEREYDIQRIDGLEPKMVTPPASVTARINKDNRNVAKARGNSSDLDALFTRFEWPAKGPITGVYGSQRILNGVPKWPHYGVDVGAPTGTPVFAPVDGVVTLADDLYYSGNTLILDHGMQVFSTFLHLDTMTVNVGDYVKKGEQIGTIGATGRATGPHLDWRINLGKMRLDPQTIVSGNPDD